MRSLIRMGTATLAWALASTCVGQQIELPVAIDPAGSGSAWLEEVAAAGMAQVRFVNSIADLGTMEVVANDHLAFGSTAFGDGTDYAEVGARSARFQLRGADGHVVAEYTGALQETVMYTLIAERGPSGKPTLSVVPESSIATASDKQDNRGT
ncbi:MAG: DUF4397 domain-containing protein [Gemmatimonadales bacterium]